MGGEGPETGNGLNPAWLESGGGGGLGLQRWTEARRQGALGAKVRDLDFILRLWEATRDCVLL